MTSLSDKSWRRICGYAVPDGPWKIRLKRVPGGLEQSVFEPGGGVKRNLSSNLLKRGCFHHAKPVAVY